MLKSLLPRSVRSLSVRTVPSIQQAARAFPAATRNRQSRRMASTKNTGPPAHEMVYFPNIVGALSEASAEFRKVLFTGLYSQVVLMTIPVGGEIGDEVHTVDQALTFTSGVGRATINGKDQDVKAGDLMVVPAGTQHQFINTGPTPLILYTIYSPAEHAPTTVHHDKKQADAEEDSGKDEAPAWSQKSKKENEDAGLVKLSGKY
ncbi:cupin domain-containing protein [Phlyctema vagabunda]|uniref:Cupin domain-containing protein n=1 Tax=Phlyctema vagabunda TaxID=108571 RepID=A0ABR4PVJ4_9HELO